MSMSISNSLYPAPVQNNNVNVGPSIPNPNPHLNPYPYATPHNVPNTFTNPLLFGEPQAGPSSANILSSSLLPHLASYFSAVDFIQNMVHYRNLKKDCKRCFHSSVSENPNLSFSNTQLVPYMDHVIDAFKKFAESMKKLNEFNTKDLSNVGNPFAKLKILNKVMEADPERKNLESVGDPFAALRKADLDRNPFRAR